jgi:single-strand DNA-binding protein
MFPATKYPVPSGKRHATPLKGFRHNCKQARLSDQLPTIIDKKYPFKTVSICLFQRLSGKERTTLGMNKLNNSIRLDGFLAGPPSISILTGNRKVARASLAINEKRKLASGNKATVTHWYRLVFWDRQADLAEKYLGKGKQVAVKGMVRQRAYTDAYGRRKELTEVIVDKMLLPDMIQTRLFDE